MSFASWIRGAVLVLTCLGGFWQLERASADKPSSPRVICFLHDRHSNAVVDIRVMDSKGGNTATMTGDLSTLSFQPGVPRWSPDGQRLLFAKPASQGTILVSTTPDGTSQQTILTSAQVRAFILANNSLHSSSGDRFSDADWSPDGQWVVFDFDVAYGGSSYGLSRLFAVRIADGFLVQITDDVADESHRLPRWSGSLNMISYVIVPGGTAPEPEHELWVTSPDGTARRQLIGPYSNTYVMLSPANWSNSGNAQTGESSLVFQTPGGVAILDVDLAAENPIAGIEMISIPNYELSYPDWSPDDTQLVMVRGFPGVAQIATYDLFTGASKVLLQVKLSQEWVKGPGWRAAP